jgi:ABC-type sugar transport system permease subunit
MTLIYDIFLQALRQGRYEIACTESLVLFAMIWIFHRIQFSLENKLVVY